MTVAAPRRAPLWVAALVLVAALFLVPPTHAGTPATAPTTAGGGDTTVSAPDDAVVADTSPPEESTVPPEESTVPAVVSTVPAVVSTVPPVASTVPPVASTDLGDVSPALVDEDLPGTEPPAVLVWGLALSLASAAIIAVFFVRSRRRAARNTDD